MQPQLSEHKAKSIYSLSFYKKHLPTSALDQCLSNFNALGVSRGSGQNAGSYAVVLGGVWDFAFLASFWIIQMLLVHEPQYRGSR